MHGVLCLIGTMVQYGNTQQYIKHSNKMELNQLFFQSNIVMAHKILHFYRNFKIFKQLYDFKIRIIILEHLFVFIFKYTCKQVVSHLLKKTTL